MKAFYFNWEKPTRNETETDEVVSTTWNYWTTRSLSDDAYTVAHMDAPDDKWPPKKPSIIKNLPRIEILGRIGETDEETTVIFRMSLDEEQEELECLLDGLQRAIRIAKERLAIIGTDKDALKARRDA